MSHSWLSHGLIVEQHPCEFVPFLEYLSGIEISRVLEIGVRRGGTAATWCEMVKDHGDAVVVGVDWPEKDGIGRKEAEAVVRRLQSAYPFYHAIFGDSHDGETVKLVEKYAPFDMLFIDGDHSASGVELDYFCYSGMINPRGVIAFHDIVDTPFTKSVNCRVCNVWELLQGEKHEFLAGAEWGGIGALRLS